MHPNKCWKKADVNARLKRRHSLADAVGLGSAACSRGKPQSVVAAPPSTAKDGSPSSLPSRLSQLKFLSQLPHHCPAPKHGDQGQERAHWVCPSKRCKLDLFALMLTKAAPARKDAPTNPRGIPYAPFVDKVEDYVTSRADVESTMNKFQEMIA